MRERAVIKPGDVSNMKAARSKLVADLRFQTEAWFLIRVMTDKWCDLYKEQLQRQYKVDVVPSQSR